MEDFDFILNLYQVGYELWRSSLCGGSPASHARFERMDNPQPGDIVCETTTGILNVKRGLKKDAVNYAIGKLIEVKREPYPGGWNENEEGRPAPTEEVVYIKRLDTGETVRWTNAKFICIMPLGGW